MLVIAGDWKTAGHRLRKPAQGTAPAIGRRHSPCNRTEGMTPSNRTQGMPPQQSDARHDPLQSDTRYAPCKRTPGTVPTVGCKRRPYIRWQRAAPRESTRPWTTRCSPALGIPLPSLRREGLGVGLSSKCKEGSHGAWPWKPSVVERGRLPTLPHCIAVPSA